jgi:ATP-binding cassette subfamily C (CFTR/MRP) protein 4
LQYYSINKVHIFLELFFGTTRIIISHRSTALLSKSYIYVGWFKVDGVVLGLALTFLIQLSGLFQWCIRLSAEVVNAFVSVERVAEYSTLPPEPALVLDSDGSRRIQEWPQSGRIDVENLSVRYRSALPLSLKDITFTIESGHRVGVVGRTGSGKSTLVQTLLRILEAENGTISIDGINIASVGLHKLRREISVINQVPTLFSGCSVRENLDPFGEYTDDQIRDVLEDVQMMETIDELGMGIHSMVSEGGSNFSVGQRQLLCLARAILRKNKILILDEPTANVDIRTDKLLQEAVSKSFRGATIISVAHRLDTIIDYDMILVLGNGRILEYGKPHNLLIESSGHFSSLVDDTGTEMSQELRRRARIAFEAQSIQIVNNVVQ